MKLRIVPVKMTQPFRCFSFAYKCNIDSVAVLLGKLVTLNLFFILKMHAYVCSIHLTDLHLNDNICVVIKNVLSCTIHTSYDISSCFLLAQKQVAR